MWRSWGITVEDIGNPRSKAGHQGPEQQCYPRGSDSGPGMNNTESGTASGHQGPGSRWKLGFWVRWWLGIGNKSPHHTTSRAATALDVSQTATQSSTTALFKIRHRSVSLSSQYSRTRCRRITARLRQFLDYIVFF